MTSKHNLNHDESYFVKATLSSKKGEIRDVPCKIYLPERIYEKPYLVLKPDTRNGEKIFHFGKTELKASSPTSNQKPDLVIYAPEVHFSNVVTKHWGHEVSETTLEGEPQNLHVIQYFQKKSKKQKTKLVLWISPNKTLTPISLPTRSYDGSINYKVIRNFEFMLGNGLKLTFANHYANKIDRNKNLTQWSFLVACTELDCAANDANAIRNLLQEQVEDILLIASFASRNRTVWLGWTTYDSKSQSRFYRGNFHFPTIEDEENGRDKIVDNEDFQDFIEKSYSVLSQYENKLTIRSALQSVVTSKTKTIENAFLSLFAALEALILDFRRKESLEFVLQEIEWEKLKGHLKSSIKNCPDPVLSDEQRASMYKKLNELNRISLREAFDGFSKQHSINLHDLWPIFQSGSNLGLSDIRNKLIHGDPFPETQIRALMIARQNLQYTVERALFCVLKWDVNKTNLSHYNVMNDSSIVQWKSAQEDISSVVVSI
ncbi:hypothetical protein H8L32_09380 [Undibacterium sp. CY18W]|uniref:ApeA N-terminal domain-containing protein n=1 Tax=Undibacterium hunanense TaxID=2762292 RepID=A0ABR6ZPA2_9BURK|nr:hypothetical protein [Undibacterium hunanense]MBC3917683.1 hypothetical protein [Undibacterium hunanense]